MLDCLCFSSSDKDTGLWQVRDSTLVFDVMDITSKSMNKMGISKQCYSRWCMSIRSVTGLQQPGVGELGSCGCRQ